MAIMPLGTCTTGTVSATSGTITGVYTGTTTNIPTGYYNPCTLTYTELPYGYDEATIKNSGVSVEHEELDVKYHKEKTTVKTKGKHSIPGIERVHFSGKACVVIWEDGEKTVALCGDGEAFDRYTGFMAAVTKRLFGSTSAAKRLMDEKDAGYQAQLKAEKEAKEKEERKAEAEKKARRAHDRRVKARVKDLKLDDEAYEAYRKAKEEEEQNVYGANCEGEEKNV